MPKILTSRLQVHVLERLPDEEQRGREPPLILLVHGNVSSARFFRPLLEKLPPDWHVLAPDLRGYGETEALPVDATRGLRDWADDLWAFLEAMGARNRPVHALGWSMGGGIVEQMAIDRPEAFASLTLVSPLAPYGFGGTRDVGGTPCFPDYAGSGGGTVNPDFVRLLAAGDRGDDPKGPRAVLLQFYVKPGFRPSPDLEEEWITAMLSTRVGDDHYPGDAEPSPHWPGTAPGRRGVNNAMSPKYVDLSRLAEIEPKPPILWTRGAHDQIVADRSLMDVATLGEMGVLPGWPGPEVAPPQPMVSQTRAVLERYRANGGTYTELVFENSAHSPHLEEPERFVEAFAAHVRSARPR